MSSDQATRVGEPTEPTEPTPSLLSRRPVRIGLLVVLGLLWIRFVLFAWAFPLVERHVDNPEFDNEESSVPAEPGEAPTTPGLPAPG